MEMKAQARGWELGAVHPPSSNRRATNGVWLMADKKSKSEAVHLGMQLWPTYELRRSTHGTEAHKKQKRRDLDRR
jgi:hypothetical protein